MSLVDGSPREDAAGNLFANVNDKTGTGITSVNEGGGVQALHVHITGGLTLTLQQVTDFGNTSTNQILLAAQSASTPSYSFISDANTGMFSPGADTLAWATGGSEWMRLTSAGKLGISVTSPTAWLHLPASTTSASTAPIKLTTGVLMTTAEVGAIEFDGTDLYYTKTGPTRLKVVNTAMLAAADGTTFGISSFTASDFNASAGVISLDYTNGQKATGSIPGFLSSTDWTTFNNKLTLPSLTSGSVLFSNGSTIAQDNANFFWDDTNNRLGIGTASPSAPLTINQGSTNSIALTLTSSSAGLGSGFFMTNTGGSGRTYGVYSGSDGQFHFFDQTASADRIIIAPAGDVTIGASLTTGTGIADGPGASVNGAGSLHLRSASGNPNYIQFTENAVAFNGQIGFPAGSGDFVIQTGGSTFGGGTERVRVTSTGNVGIGTASPLATLDVNGTFHVGPGNNHDAVFFDQIGGSRIYQYDSTGAVVKTLLHAAGASYVTGGSFGVGTNSPNATLDVRGNGYFGSSNDLQLKDQGGGNFVIGVTNITAFDTQTMIFRNFAATTELMRLDHANGFVGIGTTGPTGRLHVVGGTAANSANGTNITFTAQNAGAGNQNGGNIVLTPGTKTGAGADGVITLAGHVGVVSAADATYALTVYGNAGFKLAGAGGADAFWYISGNTTTLYMADNSAGGLTGSLVHVGGALLFGGSVTTTLAGGVNGSGPGFKIISGFGGGYELHGFYAGDASAGRLCLAKQADISNDASCAFNIISTTHGFGLPAMTTTQRDAISSPKSGLSIYNSTTSRQDIYKGSWQPLALGSCLFDHFADANNGTTVETDLYSDTLIASQFGANGDKVTAQYGGVFVGDATSTQQVKVYFGGSAIFDSGALGIGVTTAHWDIDVVCIRVSSSVVRCSVRFNSSFATAPGLAKYTEVTSLTLTGGLVLKVTGTAAGATGASSQITAKEGYVEFKPAA